MRKRIVTFLFGIVLTLVLSPLLRGEEPSSALVPAARISGGITPVVADFLVASLADSCASGDRAFLIELDTPGGLDTSMRDIIQAILSCEIPVIVYVYPSGARAASAGALITLAADFAVMAPGTNIGAAHPVSIGTGGGMEGDETMKEKVINDAAAYARSIAEKRGRNLDWAERIVRESLSTPASEALELKVIDLVAEDEQSLLTGLDGRRYLRGGDVRVLETKGARLLPIEMTWRQKVLNTISNPNVAYLLLMLGILGIFFEISQPGVILPGAIGAIALLLALFAFQALPVNFAGVLLILLALVLFVLEIKVVSFGMLTVGGIISLLLGSLMLIETTEPSLRIAPAIILATVAVCGSFFALILFFVIRAQKRRFVSGVEGMAGEIGEAVTDINGGGRVFVHGEFWDAESEDVVKRGDRIEVVSVEKNMRLVVRKVDGGRGERRLTINRGRRS